MYLQGRASLLRPRHQLLPHLATRLVQQVDQLDRLTRPRLEPLPVVPTHHPEPDMVQPLLLHPPGCPGGVEDHVEMSRLACVRHSDDPVSFELLEAVLDGGHVGGVVPVPAVRFADDEGDGEVGQAHDEHPVVFFDQTAVVEALDGV